jgi:PPOX class probable F420-dependent enzyme
LVATLDFLREYIGINTRLLILEELGVPRPANYILSWDTAGAEQIQALLPETQVVGAFKNVWWEVFDAPQFGDTQRSFRRLRTGTGRRENRCGRSRRSCEQAAKDLHKGGSMGIALSNDAKQLVDHANFAHLATIMSDGSPHSAPVWIGREDDLLLVCTEAGSLKGKNSLRDPRVSISMVDFVGPYAEAQIRGRVVEWRPDPELRQYDAMSLKYTGKPWPYREEKSPMVLVIEVTKARYSKQPFEHMPLKMA